MSDFFDFQKLVPTLGAESPAPRFRLGTVSAINTDRTINVTIGASSTVITSVRYLGDVQPVPGAGVWLVSDGFDLFALGVIAGSGRTFAPRAYRSTDQPVSDNADAIVQLDTVDSDSWSSWNSGNRLYAEMSGRHIAIGSATFVANATGHRAVWIEKNAGIGIARVQVPAVTGGSPTWLTVTSHPFDMTAGVDYVSLWVRQNSGGSLNLNAANSNTPSLSLIYLGP